MLRNGSESESLKAIQYILRLCDLGNYKEGKEEEDGEEEEEKVAKRNISEFLSNGNIRF